MVVPGGGGGIPAAEGGGCWLLLVSIGRFWISDFWIKRVVTSFCQRGWVQVDKVDSDVADFPLIFSCLKINY